VALYLRQESKMGKYNRLANQISYFIIAIGGIKLLTLLTGLPFPFDQILFHDRLFEPRYGVSNTIAPNTAINLILIGLALIFINHETKTGQRPSQYMAIISSLFALVSLYGYVYEISALYTVRTYLPMAPHTALCYLLLSFGILFARPDKGSMAIVIGESSSQII